MINGVEPDTGVNGTFTPFTSFTIVGLSIVIATTPSNFSFLTTSSDEVLESSESERVIKFSNEYTDAFCWNNKLTKAFPLSVNTCASLVFNSTNEFVPAFTSLESA